MGINILQPLWLLFIPLGIIMVMYFNRQLKSMVMWRRNLVTAVRIAVLILLILSLAGVHIKSYSDQSTVLIVADRSDSTNSSQMMMEQFVRDVIAKKREKDQIGIISFGAKGVVEQSLSKQPRFTGFGAKVDGGFTSIEDGLRLAYSLMPSDTRNHIILMTDGEENVGDAIQQVKLLHEQNIVVDVFPIRNPATDDVQISQVNVPEYIHKGESFRVVIKVDSNVATRAKINLYANNHIVSEQTVEIQKGPNTFVFRDKAVEGGSIVYKAEIDPDVDGVLKNNSFSQFTYIKDIPNILVIHGNGEDARELIKIYETSGDITVKKPAAVPLELSELQVFDAVILSNVSAHELPDKFLDILEVSIRHLGKGLIVTGGENSYALGGYFKTPLEKILPVNMDLKNKADLPNLGLVLVIDKSGSMSTGQYGLSKIELAKEAAIRSTEALKENDEIGVIAFDGAAQWVVKTGKIEDIKKIQDKIGSIRADGGTSILPALDEAVRSLKDRDTKLKHIILLTDGQAEKYGYDGLTKVMKEQGITLSTVAVGTGADVELLEYLAQEGNGRFYKTDEFSDLPKIFTKETFLAGKTYINNRTFYPKLTGISEIMQGVTAVPQLHGYIGTSAKQTAKVVFSSDNDEPILAAWQYGLGRTIAWTPDVKGQWSSDWMLWDQAPLFWKNILSWTLQEQNIQGYTLDSKIDGDKVHLELTTNKDMKMKNMVGTVINPEMQEEKVEFHTIAPGKYISEFTANQAGAYLVRIDATQENGQTDMINSGVVIPYSPEYDMTMRKDPAFLEKLVRESGGKLLKNADEIFDRRLEKVWSEVDITHILLILAIILFMVDIAARRINIPLSKVRMAMDVAQGAWDKAYKTVQSGTGRMVSQAKANIPNEINNKPTADKAQEEPKPQQMPKSEPKNTHTSKLLDMKRNRKL